MNHKLSNFKQNFKNTFKSSVFMLKFVWKERQGKTYVLLKTLESLLTSVFPLVYVLFPGWLIDELSDQKRIGIIVVYVCCITGLPFLVHLMNSFIGVKIYKLELRLNLKFDADFYHHTTTMDYEILENPNVQIQKDRAHDTVGQALKVVDFVCGTLSLMISLAAVFTIISTLHFIFIILIIAIAFINSGLLKRSNGIGYEMGKKLSKYDRLTGPYIYKLNNFEYAKEIRLFDLSEYLVGGFKKVYTEKNDLTVKQYLVGKKYGILTSATSLLQQLSIYAYILYKVLFENMSIGSMSIYIGIASQFTGVLNRFTSTYLSLSRMSLDINELIEFMAIGTRCDNGHKVPVFDNHSTIEFKDVSFRYPGSDRYAIQNLNLTIHGDQKICIVGLNGAGKTTFIKLLTRLYQPESGEILLNGIRINEYDRKEYLKLFAAVFQDFKIYNMLTLGENIVLTADYNEDKLDRICSYAGLDSLLEKLPQKYRSIPSKYIDEEGFEPSGGEGQRIAITRACYRGGDIFLLDEPTAALDPNAEYEIYAQFANMIQDKCAILITHRLSAVQLADKVAVFEDGHVAEYGTHAELYAKGGIYTEMFDKQAQFYRDAPQETENKTT